MKKIILKENSSLTLEEEYIPIIEDILAKNPNLPININKNVLSFNEYTVGIIKIADLIIEITSRNEAISMNSIFEMFAFIHSSDNNFPNLTMGFDLENSFELASITNYFYKLCYLLLSEGLTGTFIKDKQHSKIIRGNIIFEEYLPQELPYKGIPIVNEEYSINSIPNQIIKAALRKLKESEQTEELINDINTILREFDYVEDREFNYYELDDLQRNYDMFYSPNRYYPIVLETSIKILKDLKTSYNNGVIEWYSFLVNSNDIFEKYVRKLLNVGLKEDVTKWEEPKTFAFIKENEDKIGCKKYSPDILIDYHEIFGVSRAVLDVKNKLFSPSQQNVAELVNSGDLYQMIFYCRQLKTNIGGIIYPTDKDYLPYKIEISDEGNPSIYLISINMTDSFENRYSKLINEVKKYILKNT